MVTLYALEQLHSAALQPEDAHSVTDLRPLRIQIRRDEAIGERANVESGTFDMAPVNRAPAGQGDRARQPNGLAGEEAQVPGGLIAAAGLVEQPALAAHHAVAADRPILVADARRLGRGQFGRNL